MRYEIAQDLIIVAGGGLLLLAGVTGKDPLNIILSGVFFLFGLAVLYFDLRRERK
jgi:hypothetical protein